MKRIVLLSGGLDSAVNLAQACAEDAVELALTIDYGQKASRCEISASGLLTGHYRVRHEVIELPFLSRITNTALVSLEQEVPVLDSTELDRLEITRETAAKVWVPNRNGLFINIAAAYAEALGAGEIVVGFNAEEAATFPDNSQDFMTAINRSLAYSTMIGVRVVSFTADMDKPAIVAVGRRLGLPFEYIWSCYHGGEQMCGVCESCRRFYRAIDKVN